MATEIEDLRKKMLEIVKDLSYLYKEADRQNIDLYKIMENGSESVETVGIRLINILKTLKANSSVFIHSLYKDIVSINSDKSESERVLTDMQSLLSECKANVIVDSHSSYTFGKQVDVETMTNIPCETCNLESLSDSKELNSSSTLATNLTSLNLSNINGLSLRKESFNETPQTDDGLWNDTLLRTSANEESSIKTDELENIIKKLSTKNKTNFQENSTKTLNREFEQSPILSNNTNQSEDDDICIISSNYDSDTTIENTEAVSDLSECKKDSEELETYEGKKSALETQKISEKVQTENEDYSCDTNLDVTDKAIEDKTCEIPLPSYLQIKDDINYNKIELIKNMSEVFNEKTQNLESPIIEAEEIQDVPKASEGDEYDNPYSVKTESICSDGDEEELFHNKTINLYDEHSYSISSNESDILINGSDDSDHVNDSGNKINSTNTNHQIDSLDKDTNISDENEITEAIIVKDKALVQNETLTPTQLDYEISHSAEKIDNDAKKKSQSLNFGENYIQDEHNYSSSNSPTNKPEIGYDSDETDIDKNVHLDTEQVQLNELINFDLETPKEQTSLSRTDSDRSFEFDIATDGNLELDDTIIDENKDAPEKTSTPEPTNIKYETENKNSGTSDNVSDDDLMDCTLEEYLSDGENGCHLGSPGMKTDISQIKIEKDNETNNEIKIECENKPEVIEKKDLGDEILELLKEVPVAIDDLQSEANQCNKDESDRLDVSSEEVDQILQDLVNESKSDISSTDDYDSNVDLINNSDDEVKCQDTNKTDIQKKLQNNNLTECYIPLKRMDMSPNDIRKFKKALDDDIDWLCNLENLERKRKKTLSPAFGKGPRKKWKKNISDSSIDSFSDISSGNENSENEYRSDSPNLDSKSKKRLYEILANAICNDLRSESSEDSDDSNSDSDSSMKKKKTKKDNDTKSDTDKRRQLTKEELQKKAWRNDPLLRDKLIDSDIETLKPKKNKTYEHDSEFNVESAHFDTDSDLEDLKENNRTKLKENDISPIKRNLPDSDSTDSDSDVQYISPKKSSQINEEGDTMSPSQKGRRHIRSILSDRDLARETLEAKKEEMERIERIKERHKIIETLTQSFSSQHSEEDTLPLILDIEEDSCEPLVKVNDVITKKLKPHQRDGIKFMWDSCYESIKMIKKGKPGSGCILAHCMGLGKTLQVLALCHTLFFHKETNTKHILIVCPLSTVNNWRNETKLAFKGLTRAEQFSVFSINGSKGKQSDKYRIVENWHLRKKSMLILGYECFETLTNDAKLDKLSLPLKKRILEYLVDPGPDLVVCDEGHLIKNNKALRTMALQKIKTKRRIVLTGTPLQNNLVEYYEMVNFVKPNLLGTVWEFKRNFVNPISNGQYEDSNELDIKLMMKMTHVLHKLLVKTVQRVEETELEIYLPPMLDHAVFIQLNQTQVNLYNYFSQKVETRLARNKIKTKQFLSDFHTFQHIGTHPHLLVLIEKQRNNKVKEKDVITNEEDQSDISEIGWWKEKMPADSLQNIEYGNKLVVLKAIIEECEAVGDKLLVFSQSLCEMDLIEHFLKNIGTEKCSSWQKKVDYFRMDGTVSPEERSTICDMFNDEKSKIVKLLLMSTKVGGLGLNLTAANRVVIMTVHWNPSYDAQSIFRVYRFGQQKPVYVYRLIALDTMESKVYQRQVTKLAIAHRVIDKHHITRHYKSVDLQEMYSCIPNADDERPTPNVPEDEMLAKVILKLSCIFKYHEHKALLADRPEDKLSEQEMAAAWEDFKNNKDAFRNPNNLPLPQPHYLPQESYPFGPSFNMGYHLGDKNPTPTLYYMPPQNTGTLATQFKATTMTGQIPSTSSASNLFHPYRTSPSNQGRITSLTSTNQQSPSTSNTNSITFPYKTPQGKIISQASTNKEGSSMSNANVNSNNHNFHKKMLKIPQNINLVSKENTINKPRIVLANKTKYVSQQPANSTNTFSKPVKLVENPFNRKLVSSADVVVSQNPLIIKINDGNTSTVSGINSLKRISLKENSMPPSRSILNLTDVKRKLTTEVISKNKMPKKRTEISEQINLTEDDDNAAELNENPNIEVIQIV